MDESGKSRSAEPVSNIELLPVDEEMLGLLAEVALTNASADEVTPPLGAAQADSQKWQQGWNPERLAWFYEFHRAARAGLDGPARCLTWAICQNGVPRGSIRLAQDENSELETGIWLARNSRGRGMASAAFALLQAEVIKLGASTLLAKTTRGNLAARALLAAFNGQEAFDGELVTVRLELQKG
ncbi:RimJ/RimL family protein N-acetyltransferase [Psychromicrobium silvestre]|uniref:RimJ/RimL family protein N-acetyltransferase n=1 Tax=Psychromicrobium silvestre TaxID=1645614 RepID=A0A7Y9LR96_9MICC|nr:GNAT family N-acetyltransferase [Psychromicrobium silvestre]NYE94139.1 RimJ/RimL family protein N-acetyltransferase [Psychromicrobium silvestre]